MIEFIDSELIKALFLLSLILVFLVPSLSTQKKKSKQLQSSKKSSAKYYWFAYVLFITALIFFQADSSMMQAKENVKLFRGAKVIRCTNDGSKYRVSKQDGWQVDGFYFIKDSLMIRADKCEE